MHTQLLMKQPNIHSVPDMLLLNSVQFYYKYKRSEFPDYFASFNFHTQGSSHDYSTCQIGDIMTNKILIRINTHCMGGFASVVKIIQ